MSPANTFGGETGGFPPPRQGWFECQWNRELLSGQPGSIPALLPCPGHSSGPESHPRTVTPGSSQPGDRFLGRFIIPDKMNVLVSTGHRADAPPQLSGSSEHCVMCYVNTTHFNLDVWKSVVSSPARAGNGLGWKTLLWGVGGRRGCATQEINNQIFVKLLLQGTRQITSGIRDGKKP